MLIPFVFLIQKINLLASQSKFILVMFANCKLATGKTLDALKTSGKILARHCCSPYRVPFLHRCPRVHLLFSQPHSVAAGGHLHCCWC
jgi:hypothetical protein